jgi:type IV fimbrial biogenesis protein FimT
MNNYTHANRHQCGITLLDLLATLSISAILSTAAFSGLSELKATFSVMADKNSLLTLVKSARQTAITNNSYTTICHLKDNECTDFLSPLTGFTDNNNNQILDTDEIVIARATIDQSANVYWNRHNRVRFEPNGRAGGFNGTLQYCKGHSSFNVIISRLGRLSVKNADLCD